MALADDSGTVTAQPRLLAPWWFDALWHHRAQSAFLVEDAPPGLRPGDIVVMQDRVSPRRLRGHVSHIFCGPEFVDPHMICVSFDWVTQMLDTEEETPYA